jgi:hypothetical protein
MNKVNNNNKIIKVTHLAEQYAVLDDVQYAIQLIGLIMIG